ncbi:sugar ABC transporter substrate-binding protein [Streptomyces sp. NP160]|uniref:ABC transporter substrate-binding protein n=1 Tax=Streptomyces sp. NP160 TaxID=2586637 RepID=UPI001117E09F|nr:sugar ABC transporter substrate-binding protein [Streptomyces sp. NP160]TNM69466.1 sugar ABC transporter substrate-binding protein [Streptomyces sp. NP160]
MRTRREFLALAGVAGLAGLSPAIAGCGSGVLPAPDTAAPGFGQDASGVLRLWARSDTQTGTQAVVDAFHASQDRIRVELTPVLGAQYVTKLATAIRARAVPDLLAMNDIDTILFIVRDVFTDLTDLAAQLPGRDQLSPGQTALSTLDDRVFGLPFLADNSVLWYNSELFDRAGVDPASLTDLDGCLAAARAVRGLGGDTYGWSLPGNSSGIIGFVTQPHVWAAGTDVITGEVGQQRGDVEGNAALRSVLGFYRTMWSEDLLPRASFADAGTSWGSDFTAGRIGMLPGNYFAAVMGQPPEVAARTGVSLLPGPTGGVSFFTGGDNLCIPRGAQNASAAWEFVRFALDVAQQERLPEGGYFPVRADAATDRYREEFPLAVAPLEQIQTGYAPRTLSYNLLYNQPDSPYFEMFRRAVFDGDVDGAVAGAQGAYDRILEQAQR